MQISMLTGFFNQSKEAEFISIKIIAPLPTASYIGHLNLSNSQTHKTQIN
jgi:hypothetical protein